jgi:short-subunit dehydrogenase
MTRKVLPLLLEHREKTGKKGAILNIASYAGLRPCPTSANYSATKACVNAFTRSIELGYHGTIVE